MSQFEVRVHIAAPSMVKDDAKWRDVAQKTMNFKPAMMTKISDTTISSESTDSPGQSVSRSTHDNSAPPDVTSVPKDKQMRDVNTSNQSRLSLKRKRNVGDNIPFKRSKQGLNPAYKAPLVSQPRAEANIIAIPRPRTAPEATVLVPFTVSPRVQRSRSDESLSRSFGSLPTQELVGDRSSRVDETSLVEGSSNERRCRFSDNTAGVLTDNSIERHRFPCNQEQLAALRRNVLPIATDNNSVTLQLSQTSLNEDDIAMGTRRQEGDLTDINDDMPSDRLPRHTQLSESTASVSPSDTYKYRSSPLERRSNVAPVPTPVIDLTEDAEEDLSHITHRYLLGPVSSPVRGTAPHGDFEEICGQIYDLKKYVYCAVTNTNTNQPFRSCITQYFEDLAQRFDLPNSFQLYAASGNVGNRTRGYWQLLICIDDITSSAKTHESSFTGSQWVDGRFIVRQDGQVDALATTPEREAFLRQTTCPAKDPSKPVSWSADHFMSFWALMTKLVERGRGGYDCFIEIHRRERTEQGLEIQLRMYCWGEVLSHTWLLLHAASNGLVCRMPAQWLVPNRKKGGAVLTMSGQPKNPGDVGRWVEKESGPDGFWGLEQSWDGIESTQQAP